MRDLTRSQNALYGLFPLAFLFLLIGLPGIALALGSIPGSVEDAVRYSEIIVLGRVTATDAEGIEAGPMKQLVTRHSFKVDAYYKGNGPDEISLITLGGMEMKKVGNEIHPVYTQALGDVGVKDGEEMLAFLRSGPAGYYFVLADGAKYQIGADPESGERWVDLRIRKKRYMQAKSRAWFEKLERMDKDSNAPVESELPLGKFVAENISVADLSARLQEIIQGEAIPAP